MYATPDDLRKWAGRDIPNPEMVIRDAEIDIDRVTKTAVYETNEDGAPTDPKIAGAFRDAVCAQATWVDDTGGEGGVGAPSQLGSLRFDASDGTDSRNGVSNRALAILDNAGLLTSQVGVRR